ncbi:TetR/AcrR family transcriptional regulator [Algoriphagus sp. D3-2-R+10]|uniref:TetR/AcrR family transcriptional regulator n=1 Tax=Algoriphagus aurantiacus TaxID=3103948 RepID=UPI002B3B1C40|nr:TetR/AcrR family transcriptional regulator [Algoriphagus sp. D3-2-R+10]MEB2775282.1 TetR/AcrR family transcriptional regulator [Algoriphagus sp. D3-2-R+10]
MENLLNTMKMEVHDNLYLKEPFSSELGSSIVQEGATLIRDLGMEHFTFKKLANHIGVTEAAVYRYFENKHMLLLYLTAWYWAWMEVNYVYATANLESSEARLSIAMKLMVNGPFFTRNMHINPEDLRNIVVNESLKGYLTKTVDVEHESGIFAQVYNFGQRISNLIFEINPSYPYPKTLAYTVIESSLLHAFNAKHLPGMTEQSLDAKNRLVFFENIILKAISNE